MIIREKNAGRKIEYEVSGNRITFDDDLSLNLQKREEDEHTHIDICRTATRELIIGAGGARRYVAEIDIPARRYIETEEDGEPVREAVPFDMDNVTLTLWAIE